MPRISKKFALMLVLAMIATMFVGMGTVSATTTNTVTSTPVVQNPTDNAALGSIWAYENSDQAGSVFYDNTIYVTVTMLTSNVTFHSTTPSFGYVPAANNISSVTTVGTPTNKTYTLKVVSGHAAGITAQSGISLAFNCDIAGASSGPIEVQVDAPNSGITSGKYTIGSVAGKGTVATVLDTSTIQTGKDGQDCGLLRIQDAVSGSLKANDKVYFDLPDNVTWDQAATEATVSYSGCAVSSIDFGTSASGFDRMTVNILTPATAPQVAMITFTPVVDVDDDFTPGDIVVQISGNSSDVTNASATIGTAADYGIKVEAAGDPTTIVAGELDQGMQDFRISETVSGSLLGGRNVLVTLPSYVHWFNNGPSLTYEKGDSDIFSTIPANEVTKDDNRNTKKFVVKDGGSDDAAQILFGYNRVYVDPDAPEGDVTITVSGTAGVEGTAVVAKVVKPITATGGSNEMIIGEAAQQASDLVITETGSGLIKANPTHIINDTDEPDKDTCRCSDNLKGALVIDAPDGVTFANVPTATVDGNLKLKSNAVKLFNGDNSVEIDIDTSSTAAATLTLSDINLTIDRTVPVGDLVLKVGGNALDRTSTGDTIPMDSASNMSNFKTVASAAVGKVVTPAPTEKAHVSVFTIGSTSYTVDGVEQTMDAAPYIKDGRTFLPIAYVANAMGISGSNILWDGVNQTVTLMKGDKVVQLKIGSYQLLINGAAVAMDVVPEITNSRTCLPVSLVANAFGFTATWDPATQTVTIQ